MRILVTGGTGVIGAGLLPELLRRGHEVRLLSRHADNDLQRFPRGILPFNADVADVTETLRAAEGCDAVIHIAGIVDENPPELTYEKVNVEGTRNIVAEAERGVAKRFVYISSLGADRGASEYHKSKVRAEELVRASSLDWVILRPGLVYGPGDEVISMLLKLVRNSPVVPMVGSGDQEFQPIWFEDLAKAIAELVETDQFARETVDVAGPDVTTTREVLERLGEITNRPARKIPIPTVVASIATKTAESIDAVKNTVAKAGLEMPLTTSKLQMLLDGNVIANTVRNALADLRVTPTPLDAALRRLANELPELLPEQGVGNMERKVFSAEIAGSRHDAAALIAMLRERIDEAMPIEFRAEPDAPDHVERNATLTGAIPGRGHFQVRAVDVNDCEMTFLTVEGHPIAGLVTFRAENVSDKIMRFTIEIYARASNFLDWLALRTIGQPMQNANWRNAVQRVVEMSGGRMDGDLVESHEQLSAEEAERVNDRAQELANANAREFAHA